MTDFTTDPFNAEVPKTAEAPVAAPVVSLPEAPISFTFKVGGSLFTVRAADAKGFKSLAQDVIGADLITIAEFLNKAAGAEAPSTPAAAAPSYQAAAQPAQNQPTSSQACAHGPLVYDTWQAKGGGKLYKAFKCPLKVANWKDPSACDTLVWAN